MLTCTTCHKQIRNPVDQLNVITDRAGSRWCVVCASVSLREGIPVALPGSQGQCVEIVSFPRYYSGALSSWFWDQVALIKNQEDKGTIYFAGVLLQEMEERVVSLLETIASLNIPRKYEK